MSGQRHRFFLTRVADEARRKSAAIICARDIGSGPRIYTHLHAQNWLQAQLDIPPNSARMFVRVHTHTHTQQPTGRE